MFDATLSFDDVLLTPRSSDVESRAEVDIGSSIGDISLSFPVLSSPMDTVTESEMCISMLASGGLGVIHRYNTIDEQCQMVRAIPNAGPIGAAVGVSDDFLERSTMLAHSGVSVLCIDVAHGHHTMVERAIKTLRDAPFGDNIKIMAGNVATAEAFADLQSWGADAIRVGVGGGSICSTRIQTGHGIPTFQSVLDCSQVKQSSRMIADGGIKTSGDIVKSIAAGADLVMLGSLLSGTDQSPGNIFVDSNSKKYKVYRGMASREAQEEWRGEARSLEGISTTVQYKGSVDFILKDLAQNIRSGFSYSGARNQDELRERARFVQQTVAGNRESNTHILGSR